MQTFCACGRRRPRYRITCQWCWRDRPEDVSLEEESIINHGCPQCGSPFRPLNQPFLSSDTKYVEDAGYVCHNDVCKFELWTRPHHFKRRG